MIFHDIVDGSAPPFDRLPAAFGALEPRQRRLAFALVEELAPEHRRAWLQELAQTPHAAAVALLRAVLQDGEDAANDNAAPVAEIGPLQAFLDRARFFAVLVKLTPADRRLAQALVDELPTAARRRWLRQLAAEPLQDAAARVRGVLAAPSPPRTRGAVVWELHENAAPQSAASPWPAPAPGAAWQPPTAPIDFEPEGPWPQDDERAHAAAHAGTAAPRPEIHADPSWPRGPALSSEAHPSMPQAPTAPRDALSTLAAMPLSMLGPLPLAAIGAALVMLTRSALAAQPAYLGAAGPSKAEVPSAPGPACVSDAAQSLHNASAMQQAPTAEAPTAEGAASPMCAAPSACGEGNAPSPTDVAPPVTETTTNQPAAVPYLRLVQALPAQPAASACPSPSAPHCPPPRMSLVPEISPAEAESATQPPASRRAAGHQASTETKGSPTAPGASASPAGAAPASHGTAPAASVPLSFTLPPGALSLPLNSPQIAAWLTSWLALPSHERFNVAIAALTAVLPLATTSTAPPSATTPRS